MTKKHGYRGTTLIELLVVLTITVIILSLSLGIRGNILANYYRVSSLNGLLSGFRLARSAAINRKNLITICPLGPKQKCTTNWQLPIVIFLDRYNQKKLTNFENKIGTMLPPTHGTLITRPTMKSYFQFDSLGMSHGSMGHISYCPNNSHVPAGQLILSRTGNVRLAADTNGDGLPEQANGKPISDCRTHPG